MSRDKSEGDEQLLWWSMKVDTNVLYISVVEGDALGALDALGSRVRDRTAIVLHADHVR